MEWIMVIYIFVAGEWLEHDQQRFRDAESCIQAQWRFTAENPATHEIRASCHSVD